MKKLLQIPLLLVALFLTSIPISAHDFEVDGIYYNILSDSTVRVTYRGGASIQYDHEYTGVVTIPFTVTYSGTTYSVTSIGSEAFAFCYSITSVNIPSSVTSIGNDAFRYCDGLTSVTIPNSVAKIGEEVFYSCDGLTSVTIGNSVTTIGSSAFYNCINLKLVINLSNLAFSKKSSSYGYIAYYANRVINVPNGYIDGDFVWAEKDNVNTLVEYLGNATELILPMDFNGENYKIGSSAFNSCSGLASVTIPNSVTSIGDYAFKGCTSLNEVNFYAEDCTSMYQVFLGCTSLKTINIGDNVKIIPAYAFYGCSGLTSVTIPNSVTEIGSYAFRGCTGLTSVTIPNSVTEIGHSAFEGCSGLKFVSIGNSVSEIGSGIFKGCYGICSLTIGSGVSSISSNAFSADPTKTIWLTNTPPNGFEYASGTINYVANDRYSSLSNVVVYPYLSSIFEVGGIRYVPVSPSERTCDAIDCAYDSTATNINIENEVLFKGVGMSVKEIKPYACYKNPFIKECKIKCHGDIGKYAFYGCSAIEGAVEIDNLGTIDDYSFYDCLAIEDLVIGDESESIGHSAFYNCSSVKSVVVGKNMATIRNYAFYKCSSLTKVIISDKETLLTLGSNGSSPLFSSCPLDSVYIGGNISYNTSSSYGYSPFYNNTSLRTVTITDKETEISANEFYGCSNLRNVVIGDGVESFGGWAFSGCSSLETFAFGSNVKTIGKEAFSDCTSLVTLRSRAAEPPVCGTQALDDINKWSCELFVPEASIGAYQTANQWKEFFFISPDGIEEVMIDDVAIKVKNLGDAIMIEGVDNAMIDIYSVNGTLIKSLDNYNGESINLSSGVYVLKINNKTIKIAI